MMWRCEAYCFFSLPRAVYSVRDLARLRLFHSENNARLSELGLGFAIGLGLRFKFHSEFFLRGGAEGCASVVGPWRSSERPRICSIRMLIWKIVRVRLRAYVRAIVVFLCTLGFLLFFQMNTYEE